MADIAPAAPGGGVPIGSVIFSDAAGIIGKAAVNANGIAYLDAGEPAVGDYAITASFSGDANFNGSTRGANTLTITQATPTVSRGGRSLKSARCRIIRGDDLNPLVGKSKFGRWSPGANAPFQASTAALKAGVGALS